MKKMKLLLVAAAVAGLVTGCSSFKPDQTGILVKKNGSIESVIKESLDKAYYDQSELETMINETVDSYNTGIGENRVTVEKYEVANSEATLEISYDSGSDYQALNQVKFYQGDLAGTQGTEYQLQGTFLQVEKGTATGETLDAAGVLATSNYSVVVLEEAMLVEVPGDIVFVSSNMEVLGKRQAIGGKSGSTGTVNTETQAEGTTAEQTQTDASGIPIIHPEGSEPESVQESTSSELFYIIYK